MDKPENTQELKEDGLLVRAIIRAWKDDEYKKSLPEDLARLVPENPAGVVDMLAGELGLDPEVSAVPSTYGTKCSEGWRCLSVSKC
ncbi:mersacidin/lichenicidin family type 2 lantibiotic [Arthrobacter sp. ok362]|uniref:mersacidin/lichenicidin family type 2 lantibiotic n=1 Tax=Arthrobacter sp. ok362 TaxID=1761745 RepID=UPI00087EC0CA|nr:mersacidin/lichenicidin family type 2 lantibiotic [Arthrobacter sp. ok362]SDL41147.1 type 2 lantibiotic, mersacidin/lichenicidin family [Arthrobacter sp. ok362]